MELDKTTKQNIRNTYFPQYIDKAVPELTGFSKMVMDLGDKFTKKMKQWEDEPSWQGAAKLGLSALGTLGALVVAFNFVPMLTLGAVFGVGLAGAIATKDLYNKTNDLLDRDIANGTLVTRYNAEVKTEVEAPQPKASNLPASGVAGAEFAAAVAPAAPVAAAPVAAPAVVPAAPKN